MISTDIKFYLSGGTANTDPNLSLGGMISNTQAGTAIHQLFDLVLPAEALAGDIEYRCIWAKNTHVSETLYGAKLVVSLETTSTSTVVAWAYDATGTQVIASEKTAPVGLTFSTPYSYATGIALGDMAPNSTKMIWVKWSVTAGALKMIDAGQLTITGGIVT